MKKFTFCIIGIAGAIGAHGQGYLVFDNFYAPGITLSSSVPGEGNVGDYLGSDYRAALYYEIGTFSGTVNPSSLTAAGSVSAVPFYGTTGSPANGHSPAIDGAGIFFGDNATIPGTADGTMISVEVAIWYAGPGATSYESAKALGYNTGYSSLATVRLVSGIDPLLQDVSAANSFASGFTPGTLYYSVPEPSTIALGALGGAALLLFCRRK